MQGILDSERYTAELEVCGSDDPMLQYDLSKIRAVIGTHCRFHGVKIAPCGCGICKELRLSLKPEYRFYEEDEYHYMWCQRYVVRPPWIINSARKDALRTITMREDDHMLSPDWNDGNGPEPKSPPT